MIQIPILLCSRPRIGLDPNYDVCVQMLISHVSLWFQPLIHVCTRTKSIGNCLFGTFLRCKATIDLADRLWDDILLAQRKQRGLPRDTKPRASSVLLFPTFWGLSYFFLLLGKIPTFSYFFRFLLKLID